jgi:hypothetical protein
LAPSLSHLRGPPPLLCKQHDKTEHVHVIGRGRDALVIAPEKNADLIGRLFIQNMTRFESAELAMR